MEFTFLDECGDPYISCCKAAKELEQLRTEITRLTTALAAAEKDICKLIDGTCPNIDALEKNFQHSQSELGKTIARAEKAEKRAEAAIGDLTTLGKKHVDCHTCDAKSDDSECVRRYTARKNVKSLPCWKWRGEGEV